MKEEELFDRIYEFLTGMQKKLRGKCQTQISVYENGDILFGTYGKDNQIWWFYDGVTEDTAEDVMQAIREFFGY